MDPIEGLVIESELNRLVTTYCHLVDHGQAARVAELFAEDGVWTSSEQTLVGRAEIARAFARRQANAARISRHVCTGMLAQVHGPDRAEAVTYLTLYRHDSDPPRRVAPAQAPAIVGEYRDQFVRTPDGWRFRHREVVASFA